MRMVATDRLRSVRRRLHQLASPDQKDGIAGPAVGPRGRFAKTSENVILVASSLKPMPVAYALLGDCDNIAAFRARGASGSRSSTRRGRSGQRGSACSTRQRSPRMVACVASSTGEGADLAPRKPCALMQHLRLAPILAACVCFLAPAVALSDSTTAVPAPTPTRVRQWREPTSRFGSLPPLCVTLDSPSSSLHALASSHRLSRYPIRRPPRRLRRQRFRNWLRRTGS